MKGWRFVYLNDYVTPAELPEDMDGFKAQQHRWTKGCIQVCQKMLFDILRCKNVPFKAKMEATTHLTCNYSYLALILLCILVIPISTSAVEPSGAMAWDSWRMILLTGTLFFFATVSVCIFYITAEVVVRPKRWWMVFPLLIPLLALGVGMAVNNAKAVLEAMFTKNCEFVRTPKFGGSKEGELSIEKRSNGYKALKSVLVPVLELMFGTFFAAIQVFNLLSGNYPSFLFMLPFLGFFYTGLSSVARLLTVRRAASAQN